MESIKDYLEILNSLGTLVGIITAVVALYMTKKQDTRTKKAILIERKIEALRIIDGLFVMMKKKTKLENVDESEPFYALDFQYIWMTNNSFMETIQASSDKMNDTDYQRKFHLKMDELSAVAFEVDMFFSIGKAKFKGRALHNFVVEYRNMLNSARDYILIMNIIDEDNESNTNIFEYHAGKRGELRYRKSYVKQYNKMIAAMNEIDQGDCIEYFKNEIRNSMK